MYKLLRSFLFLFDPEWVHYFSMNSLRFLCRLPGGKAVIASIFNPKGNNQYSIFNIQFPNRIGLGAGFDKNARYLNELEALGFGCVEIGTVTPLPQPGNDKPRLFRLPKDKALINRMGFNNDGVDEVVKRLKAWREKNRNPEPGTRNLVIGGNIGKNKITPNEEAWKDYEKCFLALHPYVDYFVVNVSSPNTPGLRELQEKDALHKILTNLQNQNSKCKTQKPILLKIAPDLTQEQIDAVIELALEIKLDGLVASNTTISREQLLTTHHKLQTIGAGGLSGLPVKARSTEIVKYIHQKTQGRIPIIASGGIFTGADAMEKINAGASLVQVWTGFIYEGPSIVKNICRQINKYQ
ncbi:MAG: quinone-dependent dihydroorotate dehydrogenase [Chitinophagales bacterium]|jgi:dihydroorotate dehydrogenase|nr:quinone-dependent dihydroorotate dehydrogenase [Chitinophagales bacterium]